MKKISSYILKYWYTYLIAIIGMLLAITLDMLYPQVTKVIVNDVFVGGKMEILPKLLFIIAAIGIGRCIGGYVKEFTFDWCSAEIASEMRKDLFNHIQGLSVDFFDKTNTGELMARVKDDVDKIWSVLGYVGMLIIEVVVHISFVLYCMFRLNWKLTFVPLVFMIVSGIVAVVMEQKLGKVYGEISEENAALTTVAEENLAGVRTVKAFAREKFEIQKFLSHNKRYYELNMEQSKVMVRYYPFFKFVSVALPVSATALGGFFVMKGEMNIGELAAYIEYTRNCTWPMEMIGWLANDFSSAIASHKKIKKIYENVSSVKESENPVRLETIKGDINFEHVDFEIDGNKILEDITFHVQLERQLVLWGRLDQERHRL